MPDEAAKTSPLDPLWEEHAERIAARVADILVNQPLPVLQDYLSPGEAAVVLGVPERTLGNWRARNVKGGPPWSIFGQTVRYARADLIEWMRANRKGA
jgi:hypothetical protein